MKKELAALALLLALIVGSLVNISYLQRFAGKLGDQVSLSRSALALGDRENAERMLRDAIDAWLHADGYTHIFIRHSEIDSTTDAFFDLLSQVGAGDPGSAQGAYEKVTAHLQSLVGMEKLTLGSIF